MQSIGMVGLGRMGGNMGRRIARGGLDVVAWDRAAGARAGLATEARVKVVETLEALVEALAPPRVVWLMLPAGGPDRGDADTTAAVDLAGRRDRRRGERVVSGFDAAREGVRDHGHPLRRRGCVGRRLGSRQWLRAHGRRTRARGAHVEPFLRLLAPAPDQGWIHCGPSGAGHFAKMVHNGIEYGLMQAYAEGLALLEAKHDLQLDVAKIADSWRYGTVIRSWLLDLTAEFLAEDAKLESIAPLVADSGEGRWTAAEAIELGVPTPVMTIALMERFASQGRADYANRLLARLRQSFGGHAVKSS
jgi:6-phosphogluconate dehydrogenase